MNRILRSCSIPTVFGLLFALSSLASYAGTVLAPGSTWEYTFADPTGDPAWDTTTGGWTTGAAPFGNVVGGDFGYNTFWPADAGLDDDLWVRTAVDLTGYDLTTVHYDLGVDNGFKLYANGTLVSSDNAEGYTFRWEYGGAISAGLLNSGLNVIALALEDHGGLTAFDMQITADKAPSGVPDSSSALNLFLVSLVGLAMCRRLRST